MAKPTFSQALAIFGAALDAAVAGLRSRATGVSPPVRSPRARASAAGRRSGGGLVGRDAQAAIHSLLRSADGPVTSGVISRRTGVAKSSVGKHMKALKRAGVKIQSAPRRGYELLGRAVAAAKRAAASKHARRRGSAGIRGGDGSRGRRAQEIILQALRTSKKPVLGAFLAKKAAVSKMTITRMVAELRKKGTKISGQRGIGYRLIG